MCYVSMCKLKTDHLSHDFPTILRTVRSSRSPLYSQSMVSRYFANVILLHNCAIFKTMVNDNRRPTESLEPEVVEKKRHKKSKTMKRHRHLQASTNDNLHQEALNPTVSVSTATNALDTTPISFSPENLLMDGPRPSLLDKSRKGKTKKEKKKTKEKKKSAKSKSKELSIVDETSGFTVTQMASIEDWQDEQVPDRKLTPAEKAVFEADRHHDSINSAESSIFSSHPIASTAARDAASHSNGNGRNRSSILDDVDSVGIGMTGKSDDDTITWAGFPDLSSKVSDFPLQSSAAMQTVEQAQIPQVLSVSSVARSRSSRSSGNGDEQPEWESVLRKDQPSLVEGTDVSTKTKSSGESTPIIENIQARQRPESFPIHSIIMQKAEEAMASSVFPGSDFSSTRKPVAESARHTGAIERRQRIVSHSIHSITMQQKAEEAMKSSVLPPAQRGQRSLPVVKPGMSDGRHLPSNDVAEDSGSVMPADMLVRYLRSMGTSYRTAVDIASRFREQQAAQGSTPVARVPPASSSSSPSLPIQSSTASTRVMPPRSTREGAVVTANSTPGRNRGSGARARTRRSQNAFLWERSVQPGAVQMEGRAFGAPIRPDLPERPAEDDGEIILEAVEAMAVDDMEQGPVVYADSTPLSWKDLLKEKSIRRRVFVLCFIIVAVTVISVSLAVVKSPGAPDVVASATNYPTTSPSMAPTFIKDDILSYTANLSGSEAVSTPGTPQHSAVGWLSTFDTFSEGFNELFDQRYAMVTFFYSLGGEDWLEQDSWLAPDMHECEWSAAIFCNADGTGRRIVSGLDLTKNGLLGSLPAEIGLTTQLEFLRLSKNQIQGTVPSELFVLPVLGILDLHMNELVGSLPENLGTEQDMVLLDISYNMLTGTIPDGFCNLSLLRIADLKSNHFSGRVPSNLQKLKVIDKLSLSSNALTGPIPEFSVDDLPVFDSIDLGNNMLTGSLPSWVLALVTRQDLLFYSNLLTGTFPDASTNQFIIEALANPDILSTVRLQRIDLSNNDLSGTIPNWGAFMPTVEVIDLHNNKFNGTVPFGIGRTQWPSLKTINLANNTLSGSFPNVIPSALSFLDVSGNLLEGTVPLDLPTFSNLAMLILDNNQRLNGNLSALLTSAVNLQTLSARNTSLVGTLNGSDVAALRRMEILDLGSNVISGTIPTEFGDLQVIKRIFLESNRFSGSIPSELGSLDDLLMLSLSNNLLSGLVPQTLGGLTSLEGLTLAGNELISGSVPEELCSLDALNMTRDAIGCELACSCCFDPLDLCEGVGVTAIRSNIFVETHQSGR